MTEIPGPLAELMRRAAELTELRDRLEHTPRAYVPMHLGLPEDETSSFMYSYQLNRRALLEMVVAQEKEVLAKVRRVLGREED